MGDRIEQAGTQDWGLQTDSKQMDNGSCHQQFPTKDVGTKTKGRGLDLTANCPVGGPVSTVSNSQQGLNQQTPWRLQTETEKGLNQCALPTARPNRPKHWSSEQFIAGLSKENGGLLQN